MSFKVIKYRKPRKIQFETYEPEKRVEIHKGNTLYFLINVWHTLLASGNALGFLISSAFVTIKEFFGFKKKVVKDYRYHSKYEHVSKVKSRYERLRNYKRVN